MNPFSRSWYPVALISLATLATPAARAQTFGVDVRTAVSATSSTLATRFFLDAARTPAPVGTRVWFVIDVNGDGVPAAPTTGAILGPDDVLALEDTLAGSLPANPTFAGRFARNGHPVADAYRNETDVYAYVWRFEAPLTEVPHYEPPAGASYGVVKVAATPKPELGNAIWRVAEDVFADARTVGGGGPVAPGITQPPQPQSVAQGAEAVFAVTAEGTPPLSFQWLRNGTALSDGGRIAGSATAQLVVSNAQPEDAGSFEVIVSNAAGSVRSAAVELTVRVPQPPTITQSPQPQALIQGGDVTFAVGAQGTPPLSYQWWRDDVVLIESPKHVGVNTATLTIVGVQVSDQGLYAVTVTNAAGSATSEGAQLTVYPAPPVITQPPQSQSVALGDPVSFEVVATATEPVSYQWFLDGTVLVDGGRFSGAKTARLQIAAVEATDAGDYRVSVEDAGGSVISAAAKLTVRPSDVLVLTRPIVQGTVVRFAVSGTAGRAGEVQHSEDLRAWQRLTELQLGERPVDVTDSLGQGLRYYRAVLR